MDNANYTRRDFLKLAGNACGRCFRIDDRMHYDDIEVGPAGFGIMSTSS